MPAPPIVGTALSGPCQVGGTYPGVARKLSDSLSFLHVTELYWVSRDYATPTRLALLGQTSHERFNVHWDSVLTWIIKVEICGVR